MASDRVRVAVDENLLAGKPNVSTTNDCKLNFDLELPKDGKVVEATSLGLSDWCDTTQYNVQLLDGSIRRFFEKA